ncbi:MAG: VWA domain-containing protein, partial [Actinomycetota bacterium]
SKENREAARTFIEEFRAVGGTAIDDALQQGLASLPKPEERVGRAPFLIFMTDGLPTTGVTAIDQILGNAAKSAPKDLRLFAFGVGSDVNTLLLDRLSRDNRGDADYVSQDEDLETKIGAFYAKIADPVLANVQVTVAGAKLLDPYPSKIPDLFAGSQLLILGRYQGSGAVKVDVSGELNGKPKKYSYDLTLPERELGQEFIPKLWASRRIGFLLEEIRLRGENKELKDEVVRLSMEHGVVTPYTAYLVEEPGLAPPGVTPLLGARADNQHFFFESRGRAAAPAPGGDGALGGFGRGAASPAAPAGAAGRPMSPKDQALGKRGNATSSTLYDQRRGGQPSDKLVAGKKLNEDERLTVRKYEALQQARQQADGFQRSTGANAVEASRRVRALKQQAQTEMDFDISRNVEGRSFRMENGVWRDQTARGKLTLVPVKYGSDAYFKLIAARAEWARFLSQGRQVVFRTGKRTAVVVSEKGKEKLSDQEIKALEK